MTLVEFLLARIDEDEAVARVEFSHNEDWPDDMADFGEWAADHDAREAMFNQQPHGSDCGWRMGEMWDPCSCGYPARVLAECEAKRRIVARHVPIDYEGPAPDFQPRQACRICRDEYQDEPLWQCLDLRDMAAIYADHPDYQQEWAL